MTAEKIKTRVDQLNQFLSSGKIMEALDEFYANDTIMAENNEVGTKGLAENKKREEQLLAGMEWQEARLVNVTVNEDTKTSMSEWYYVYTNKADNRTYAYTQVSIQKWENDKIKEERYIYNPQVKKN